MKSAHAFKSLAPSMFCLCAFAYLQLPLILAADWPQIAHDARRTGRSPDSPYPPFQIEWRRRIEGERIGIYNQPVTGAGKVFVGTLEGVMHCWPLDGQEYKKREGNDIWTLAADGPIVQAAAYENGRLFFGAADGRCYALDAETGAMIWTADAGRPGFSQAALVAGGKLFLGDRAGVFYAFDLESGEILWRHDAGEPFLASAAYNDGRVFCAAEDMKLRALDAKTGALVWESDTMPGNGIINYYPVVDAGRVAIRTIPFTQYKTTYRSFSISFREEGKPLSVMGWHSYPEGARLAGDAYWRDQDTPRPERLAKFNAAARAAYAAEPEAMTLHVFDAATGERACIAPIVYNMVNTGAPFPPVVGADGFWYAGTTMSGQANECGMVKIDPATGDIIDVLQEYVGGYDSDGWGGRQFTVMPDGSLSGDLFLATGWTGDEHNMFCVGGNVLYGTHWSGAWDALDLETRVPFSHADYVNMYSEKWGKEQGYYVRKFATDFGANYGGPIVSGRYFLAAQESGVGDVICVKSLAGDK